MDLFRYSYLSNSLRYTSFEYHCSRPLPQVKIALLKFLQEATQFYKQLAVKLQATFGDVGFTVDAQSQISSENVQRQQQQQQRTAASAVDARISVYRCLICLGDLARCVASQTDWRIALFFTDPAHKSYTFLSLPMLLGAQSAARWAGRTLCPSSSHGLNSIVRELGEKRSWCPGYAHTRSWVPQV